MKQTDSEGMREGPGKDAGMGMVRSRCWSRDTRQPKVLGAQEPYKIDMNKKRTC